MAKKFDMQSMNVKTLENLMHFLSLTEGDTTTKVNDKINKTRVEVVGAKSNKTKKEAANKF